MLRFAVPTLLILVPALAAFAAEDGYTPHKLGPSLKDQARARLGQGRHRGAIDLYEQWLKADPRDESSWYNLACCYALVGRKEDALTALEKAVDAGWTDHAHTLRDDDLKALRSHPRFKGAVARAKKAAERSAGPKECKRHFLTLESQGTYIVALPPGYEKSGKRYPMVLILHGSGSTELGHGRLADRLGRRGVIYVCPRAPYPHTQVFKRMKQDGYTAWPPESPRDDKAAARRILVQYVNWIFKVAADAARRYRVKGERVYIFGHSQGAGFANACALLHPELVKSYFAYAGYLAEELRDEKIFERLARRGVRPYLAHSRDDRVVPVRGSTEPAALMKKAGVPCRLLTFPTGGHGVSLKVLLAAIDWLDTEVRGKAEDEEF